MYPSSYDIYTTSSEAWEGMRTALQSAQKSIYWEVFIFLDDEVGAKFFDLLEEKARLGVDVKLIVDSLGSFWFSKKRVVSLRESGVDLLFFHKRKKRYRGFWRRLWSRTHRKILIVDEKVGFIGGVNVKKEMEEWYDLHVRIQGKAVHSLLRSFAKMYIICGGKKQNVAHLLRYPFRVRHHEIDFIYDDAFTPQSNARKKYTEALWRARERVILFSPYYFPDREFLQALWAAKRRGIRVDLLIPFRTDLRLVTYAAYFWFSIMSKLGVRIHLLKDKMMHGKGVIVDDEWAMVGSSNLDHTSFYDCYEANVQIQNRLFVHKLKKSIEKWLRNSTSLEDMNWEKRGFFQRAKEWISYRLYRLWHKRANIDPYEFENKLHSSHKPDKKNSV